MSYEIQPSYILGEGQAAIDAYLNKTEAGQKVRLVLETTQGEKKIVALDWDNMNLLDRCEYAFDSFSFKEIAKTACEMSNYKNQKFAQILDNYDASRNWFEKLSGNDIGKDTKNTLNPEAKANEEILKELINLPGIPDDVKASATKALNEGQVDITKLKEWRKARDTNTIWHTLAGVAQISRPSCAHNLESLPEDVKQFESWITTNKKALETVESLNLSNRNLTSIPESIGDLTNLKQLDLGLNKLTSLPDSFGKLNNLINLDLSQNKLTSLPESLGNLTKLTYLLLQNNKLTSLPESIGNLQNLTWLYLNNNGLNSLPESIKTLQNLELLDLNYNLLTGQNSILDQSNFPKMYEFRTQGQGRPY